MDVSISAFSNNNMYEKLLKTAREMNMTVLSKLLEAHRQTTVVPKVTKIEENVK